MSKFCSECGKELNDGAIICTNCGVKLENKDPKKHHTKLIVFLIIVLVAIVTFTITIICARNSFDDFNKNSKCSKAVECYSCTENQCVCHYTLENGTISDETILCDK